MFGITIITYSGGHFMLGAGPLFVNIAAETAVELLALDHICLVRISLIGDSKREWVSKVSE
jgi:hypothetical protein